MQHSAVIPVLFDLEPSFGPLGGIERVLHECQAPLLLVLAVDVPGMTKIISTSKLAKHGLGVCLIMVGPEGFEPPTKRL